MSRFPSARAEVLRECCFGHADGVRDADVPEPPRGADLVHGGRADPQTPGDLGDGEERHGLSVAHPRRTFFRATGSTRCHGVRSGAGASVRRIAYLRTGAIPCQAVHSRLVRLGCKRSQVQILSPRPSRPLLPLGIRPGVTGAFFFARSFGATPGVTSFGLTPPSCFRRSEVDPLAAHDGSTHAFRIPRAVAELVLFLPVIAFPRPCGGLRVGRTEAPSGVRTSSWPAEMDLSWPANGSLSRRRDHLGRRS